MATTIKADLFTESYIDKDPGKKGLSLATFTREDRALFIPAHYMAKPPKGERAGDLLSGLVKMLPSIDVKFRPGIENNSYLTRSSLAASLKIIHQIKEASFSAFDRTACELSGRLYSVDNVIALESILDSLQCEIAFLRTSGSINILPSGRVYGEGALLAMAGDEVFYFMESVSPDLWQGGCTIQRLRLYESPY